MIPRSRRDLFSFGGGDNAGSQADSWHADGAACKGRVGEEGMSAPGMVQCRGRRGRKRLGVSAWCLCGGVICIL